MSDDTKDDRPRPLLEIKDGEAPVGKQVGILRGLLIDPYSSNFMGSGLDFCEYMTTMDVLRYDRWYANQGREERERRMMYLIKLCAEQERLVEQSIQATGVSQSLIEAVIEGDWSAVQMWIEHLSFGEEHNEYRALTAKRFERFRQIAQEAYDTRPKVFCPQCLRPTPSDKLADDGRPHRCPWCKICHDGRNVVDPIPTLHPVEKPDE